MKYMTVSQVADFLKDKPAYMKAIVEKGLVWEPKDTFPEFDIEVVEDNDPRATFKP